MKENNKGSMIILTIIGIATLLVAVIGATFAYFSVTLKYKTEKTPAVVETSTMLITFETKNELLYTGAIPGRPSLIKEGDPLYGSLVDNPDSNKLSFTLTSATNMVVNAPYNVYLVIDNNDPEVADGEEEPTEEQLKANDFITNNLVYLITQSRSVTSAAAQNGTSGSVGSQYFPDNGLGSAYIEDDIDGDETTPDEYVGIISKDLKFGGPNFDEENKSKILIATGNIGSHATVETWTLEVWLRETGAEQNEDQGKVLKAHIEVEPVNQDPITYEPEKVTP